MAYQGFVSGDPAKDALGAGVAAGVTALFGSPIAGILFAFEVISRKVTRAFIVSNIILTIWKNAYYYNLAGMGFII